MKKSKSKLAKEIDKEILELREQLSNPNLSFIEQGVAWERGNALWNQRFILGFVRK